MLLLLSGVGLEVGLGSVLLGGGLLAGTALVDEGAALGRAVRLGYHRVVYHIVERLVLRVDGPHHFQLRVQNLL